MTGRPHQWRTLMHVYRGTLLYLAVVATCTLVLQLWETFR